MAINRVGAKGIASCTVAAQDIADETLTNAFFGPSTISNSQLANSSITLNGNTVSLGGSVTLKEEVDWQAVTVADGSTTLSVTAGKGYFLDTNTGVIEVFFPSSPNRGDVIVLVDYSGTFSTNRCIINTQGRSIDSSITDGSTAGVEYQLTTNDTIAYFVYVDAVKGWMVYLNQAAGSTPSGVLSDGQYTPKEYISATGGTIVTSGDFKIHSFTGDGCFVVSEGGNNRGSNKVDYLVVAGGAGGGHDGGGGGGAGGFRLGSDVACKPALAASALPVSAQTYPVTVGAGGNGGTGPTTKGSPGSNSVFSTITSAGGGGGGSNSTGPSNDGVSGGSGGGSTCTESSPASNPGGSGNTPPVSPPQGNDGGDCVHNGPTIQGGGGGGAGAAGENGQHSPFIDGSGGNGSTVTTIFGNAPQPFYSNCGVYAGGGGGGSNNTPTGGTAGSGGGAAGAPNGGAAGSGTANSGGGGGGGPGSNGPTSPARKGGAGGKGVVLLRYKFQN